MRCIDDLLNGNLTDAKVGAVNKSAGKLKAALMEEYGYTEGAATLAANYLKGRVPWQQFCDGLDKHNNKLQGEQ